MKLWIPGSLFGRMIGILLFGLVMAQTLNRSIHQYQHHKNAIQSGQLQAAQRIADLVRLIAQLDPATRRAIAAQYHDPMLRIHLGGQRQSTRRSHQHYNPRLKILRVALHDALADLQPRSIVANEFLPQQVAVNVQLPDGTLLTLETDLGSLGEEEPALLVPQLMVLFVIAGFSYVAVNWVVRPLQALANAAEELGRDIHSPPLDEEGGPIEVIRATRAFNSMQAKLIRQIHDRTRLLAAISHDLKTPITRLRLRTELLDDGDLRRRFQNDLDDMESMVTATVDFMRGVDQQESLQPVDMMALLESLQADALEIGEQVALSGRIAAPYPGRPSALKRCIGNLLDNALKYGHHASLLLEDDERQCVIRIRDRGDGIPESHLQQVMAPYYRLEASRNRDTGGTGLGLSIAQDIAQMHGGQVVLNNLPSGGLEAVLILPRLA